MRRIPTLGEFPVAGKKVFLRMDLNAPIRDGRITDDTRLRAAVPTIRALLDGGASIVGCSHLGRPKGAVVPALSLAPVAQRLRELLPGTTVHFASDAAGSDAKAKAENLERGQLLLLENVRFEPGETKDDPALASRLREMAEAYINDAFGAAHRAHASVHALALLFPQRAMGLLMEKELLYLRDRLEAPERPYTALLGGAKVSDKIPVLKALVEKVDAICVGGAMAYTFLKADGVEVGASLTEPGQIEAAQAIRDRARDRGVSLLLPVDHLAAPSLESAEGPQVFTGRIPEGFSGFDIGPKTAEMFGQQIAKSKTILWNGPMGVFEKSLYATGTFAVAQSVAESGALSVVGGGDSVAAIHAAGLADRITHISTGGGASLELLAGLELPGVKALEVE